MEKHIIVGNGPSLNNVDHDTLFKNKNCVSFNRAFIIYEKYNFFPTYYFCIDKTVLLNCIHDIEKLFDSSIQYFILLKCNETIQFENNKKVTLVEKNSDNSLYFGDVATFSIYYLYSNNITRIFDIYGCDCSYIEDYTQLNVSVKYNKNDPSRRIILKPNKNSKDPNHFIDTYFDSSTEYSVPRTKNHLYCWENISKLTNLGICFKTFSRASHLFHKDD